MPEPTIAEVDAFIAEYKTLDGFLGPWLQRRGFQHEARWSVVDNMQRQQAQLAFTVSPSGTDPSITVLFRRHPIYRVDIVPITECKFNAFGAHKLGLPARVCGPHVHAWEDHRDFVAANGFGQLPFRRPVSIADTNFIRALEVLIDAINLHVTGEQRACCVPPPQGSFSFGVGR